MRPEKIDIRKGFDAVKSEYIQYFKKYTYEHPLVMSVETNDEMRRLGQVLHKAIRHMLDHYRDYLHIMPRSERDLEILAVCDRHPFRVGTYRTDFVIDESDHIHIIEMTTRQPLNGYFTSGFFREIALEQAQELSIGGIVDAYPGFFEYLEGYIGDARHVCVIKGNNKLEEINIYPAIFENAGIPCHIIPIADLPQKLDMLKDAWVIEELNFPEIRSFPLDIIDALAECRLHNSIKTLLFTHDKRFYQVLNQPAFLADALAPSEREILKKYMVPTYVYGDHPQEWEEAYRNKDGYILKHQLKGKCVDVYAGLLTEDSVWKSLFVPETAAELVLQPFIAQKRFDGLVGDEPRNDFAAGTLLYFNQEYFGPGLYRTSSLPVSGLKDFRKIAQLVARIEEIPPGIHHL